MNTIPEGGFIEGDQLAEWLKGLLEEQTIVFSRVIASRAALRVLPNIAGLFSSALQNEVRHFSLMFEILHANAVSRIASKQISHKLIIELSNFIGSAFSGLARSSDAARNVAGSKSNSNIYAESARNAAVFTLRTFDSLSNSAASAAARSASSMSPNPADTAPPLDLATNPRYSSADSAAAWAAVTADARMLEAGATPVQMAATPLWPAGSPYKPAFDRKTFLAAAPSFEVWLDWYEPIVEGKAPWGLLRDVADKLEMRIALGVSDNTSGEVFWDREPDVVNAEIKSWVDAAREEVAASIQPRTELPEEPPEIESQTIGALGFDGNANEPIGLKPNFAGQDWSLDENSRERHAEARRLADSLLNLCNGKHAGNNALAEFKGEFELFSVSLGKNLKDLNPNFVVPRGDGIRKTLSAYTNQDDFSKLDPLPDDVLLRANQVVAAYNQFIALDTKLALRDDALFGPDARTRLIAPNEAQPRIADAVQKGVAKPEVLEATAVEAKAAPAIPDQENRASRRYSEGQRNFARKAIENAVRYVRIHPVKTGIAVVGTPFSMLASAQWVLANQDLLMSWFSNSPTMTNTLGWVLFYLARILVP